MISVGREQERRELGQIVAPDEPGVTTLGVASDHVELVLAKHLDRRLRRREQEILLPAADPQELQAGLEVVIVEDRSVIVLPLGAGRRASKPSDDAENAELYTPIEP